jgi:serine/threonine protein kinase
METPDRLGRVKQIFLAALDREPGDTASFLNEACEGDTALYRKVSSMLDAYRQNGEFLQSPAFKLPATEVASGLMEINEEASVIGKRIGDYRVLREIGHGGMGALYLAKRDDGEYEQQVAIKLIKHGLDAELIRRFRHERQILATLNHPNVARLLDGGITDDGQPYLVMEYVEGRPIDKYADACNLSTEGRLNLFLTVCSAVEYAHEQNVIHRDLKPGNILVTDEGTPKLLDFGIAKVSPDQSTNDATLTAFRVMTPEYASPEQLRGLRVTPSSDVYSLGVMLCELLTGHRPYHFKSRLPHEILQAVLETDPSRPSLIVTQEKASPSNGSQHDNEADKLRRRLRGDLDNIILMAMRKEPERRYKSVEQFSEDLRRHLNGRPIIARKDTLVYRSTRFAKRNKGYVTTSVAVACICLVLASFFTLFSVGGKTKSSIAVLPLTNSSGDPNLDYLSDEFTDDLIDNLSRLPRVNVPGRSSSFTYRDNTDDPKTAGQALGVDTVLTGNISTDGDNILVSVSLFDRGNNEAAWTKQYKSPSTSIQETEWEIVRDAARELGFNHISEADSQLQGRGTANAEAYNFFLRGKYYWNKRNGDSLCKGVEYFEKATNLDPNYALAHDGLARSYCLLGAYLLFPPHDVFSKAKMEAQRAIELDPSLPEAHTSLGLIVWLYDWDFNEAEREFKRAIELNPKYPTAHHWYGLFLGEMGRSDESIAEEKRALELDPLSLPVIADLGRVYFYGRRYEESQAQYQRVVDMGAHFGDIDENFVLLYEAMGRYDNRIRYESQAHLIDVYKAGGKKAYWRAQLNLNRTTSAKDWRVHYGSARVLAKLKENYRAIQELNLAYDAHDHRMTQLKVDPALDNLRSDPRFIALLRRVKLTDT